MSANTPLPTSRSPRVTTRSANRTTVGEPERTPVGGSQAPDTTPVITLAKTDALGWFRAHCIMHQDIMETLILENRVDIIDNILSHTELWQTSQYDVKVSADGVISNSTVTRAVQAGTLDMLRLFDKYKLFDRLLPDKTWMHVAVNSNNINTVKYIYKHANHGKDNANVLYHELYHTALSNSSQEIFDWLCAKGVKTNIKFILPNYDLRKISLESIIEWIRTLAMSEDEWYNSKGIGPSMKAAHQ